MLVPISWLRDYIDFNLSIEELVEQLDLTGTAVESVRYLGSAIENVVIGKVKEVRPHPGADHLKLALVDVGKPDLLEIVCGAPNIRGEIKVPVALAGAKLPGGIEVKERRIRGVVSRGMICSEYELGMGEDKSGIYILPDEVPIGQDLKKLLELEDYVLELEITPNRPDCLGLIGVAREIAAIVGAQVKLPLPEFEEIDKTSREAAKVRIIDVELCPRYAGRVIENVNIAPSPLWLQQRLKKAGIRPINNVVDVTNYVMLETGQPLHAFDYDKLAGRQIIVRRARAREQLKTLDGVDRELDESFLVIADAERAVALAGIMGGEETEVSETTETILLESANFNPQSIMRTARKLGLLTEASARFEKGIDPNGVILAINRAVQLIKEVAGGDILKGTIDEYPRPILPRQIRLRPERVNYVLGTQLSAEAMAGILESIGTRTEKIPTTGDWQVTIPTFRPDLEREIDLIEEIARLYGYNRITSTLPESSGKIGGLTEEQQLRQIVRDCLIAAGLNQVITYSLVSLQDLEKARLVKEATLRPARLLNPLVDDQSVLRTSLIPGLLKVVKHNLNREQENIQIFEMGRIFYCAGKDPKPEEKEMIGLALTGTWHTKQWYSTTQEIDFFDLKGIVVTLLERLGIREWGLKSGKSSLFHPGRYAELVINGDIAGFLGEIHPEVLGAYDIEQRVYVAELERDKLLEKATLKRQFTSIPKYPAVSLDLALIVDEVVKNEEIVSLIRKEGGELLESVHLFDLYRGETIPEGKKSQAYSLTFRATDRTLTDENVRPIFDRIILRLEKELGAKVRK
jgi:phenylalanyl-tRNA synthetase beta chain